MNSLLYDELVKLLSDHCNPKPSIIVQRFHFNSQTRAPGESIAKYIAALRELALYCDYTDKLSERLRDCLVCGVRHKGIQHKLLSEPDLSFKRVYALAQSAEASERDTSKLRRSHKATRMSLGLSHRLSLSPNSTRVVLAALNKSRDNLKSQNIQHIWLPLQI